MCSVNVPDEWKKMKVYNDINRDLHITFKVLQDNKKRAALIKKLNLSFQHHDIFMELRHRNFPDDVDTAFKVLYLQTYSFMGDGSTFGRYFKGWKNKRFQIENFIYVKSWIVENMDFRDFMEKYNKERVFLYLDPPYISSGKKYRHSFTLDDMKDLKDRMDSHSGSYLLNLSSYDEGMEDIFGKPDLVLDYANPLNRHGKVRWGCGYWWKFT